MTLPEAPFDDPALTPAGERLLDAASELFYRRGIRAVGVDLVAETAGTTKKTLYDRFGSKDELVALYLRRRARRWQSFLFPYVQESGPDGVLAVFDALAAWLREQGRGCAFVNAYAEVGGTGHPAESVIRAEKDWMRHVFVALACDASLGAELHLLYEGAMVAHTAGGREDAVPTARAAAAVRSAGIARTLHPCRRRQLGDRRARNNCDSPTRDRDGAGRVCTTASGCPRAASPPALLPPPAQQQDQRRQQRHQHDCLAERRREARRVPGREENVHTGHGTGVRLRRSPLPWTSCV